MRLVSLSKAEAARIVFQDNAFVVMRVNVYVRNIFYADMNILAFVYFAEIHAVCKRKRCGEVGVKARFVRFNMFAVLNVGDSRRHDCVYITIEIFYTRNGEKERYREQGNNCARNKGNHDGSVSLYVSCDLLENYKHGIEKRDY